MVTEILVILDGASEPVHGDEPTSLERARTPVLDALAQLGTLRRLRTTPDGLPAGSETGCAVLLGWSPPAPVDRAALEAAARAIAIPDGCTARRVDVFLPADVSAPVPAEGQPSPAPMRADPPTVSAAAELLRTATTAGGPVAVHPVGAHRLLLIGAPADVDAAVAATGPSLTGAELTVWPQGVAVPRCLDASTVVIGAPGAVTGLARLMGAHVIEPDDFTGHSREPLRPLADAALAVFAAGQTKRVVVHVSAPDEAAHERHARRKVDAIEAADEELLVPLTTAVHELGGVLEIVIDHGCDPRDGHHDDAPTPALRWEGETSADAGASDEPIDPDAPGLHSGLAPEDLPVMALPKRRASASGQTGRRLTERWVQPLPIETPACATPPEPAADAAGG